MARSIVPHLLIAPATVYSAHASESPVTRPEPPHFLNRDRAQLAGADPPATLQQLLSEALRNDFDVLAAQNEQQAGSERVQPSGAPEGTMVEADAALAAYHVNRVEFAPLLDNQMTIFNFEIARAIAVTNYNKALAEIDLLTGGSPL